MNGDRKCNQDPTAAWEWVTPAALLPGLASFGWHEASLLSLRVLGDRSFPALSTAESPTCCGVVGDGNAGPQAVPVAQRHARRRVSHLRAKASLLSATDRTQSLPPAGYRKNELSD